MATVDKLIHAAQVVAGSWKGVFYLALSGCLLWVYWPTLMELVHRWSTENNYSHGFLVPVFSGFLLYIRREKLTDIKIGFFWAGLAFFAAGGLLRLASAYIYFDWIDGLSFVLYLTGLTVLMGGMPAWRWAWPALGFLVFMIPLPFRVESAVSLPLQRLATQASTYVLQTLGFPALSEGNVIHLSQDVRLGIVEACNGLGMLVSFAALCTGVALVIKRPLLDKLIIALSVVPIGLVANIVRITATGILYETVGAEVADFVFHDLAGWLMMPLALGFVWIELKILGRLLVLPKGASSPPVSVASPKVTSTAKKQPELAQGKV